MAIYKVTMVFDYDGYGWTESYELNLPTSPTLGKVLSTYGVAGLANNRINLLTPAARLSYVRVGLYGTRNAVLTQFVDFKGAYVGALSAGNLGLHPNDALLLRMYPPLPGPGKSTFLRGLPVEINQNGIYVPTAPWSKALTAYIAYLTGVQGGSWGWNGVGSSIYALLADYTQKTDGTVAITCQQPPAPALPIFNGVMPTTKVILRLSGVNGKSALNGTNLFIVDGALTAHTKDAIALTAYQFGGKVELPIYQFTSINTIQPQRLMTRKCGRQLFLEVGKAPRRVRQ